MSIKNFNIEQFQLFFEQILANKIDDNSIKNFLLEINHHNIPKNAIIGAILALKKNMVTIDHHQDAIDVCGTGGDKLNTLNISTTVALTLASMGIKVAKHGNKAFSSKSGSSDILDKIGIKYSDDPKIIDQQLNSFNISFLYAPYFHPALKNLATIRRDLQVPTIFNYIGPLLNPTRPQRQIIGVSKFEIINTLAEVIATINCDSRVFLVNGFDGMDEITITTNSNLVCIDNSIIQKSTIINPLDFGIKLCDLTDLTGGESEYNAQKLIELFNSKHNSSYLDIVALNCSYALNLVNQNTILSKNFEVVKKHILSGKVGEFLSHFHH